MGEGGELSFYGGAGTVTGSKYLVRFQGKQILLDAGLFQGLKELRLRNRAKPPFDPAALDAVVLSHAHIDHSGYLPLLVKNGFKGTIHCTSGTADLLGVLLPDSAHLQEEESRWANKRGYSKHHPALPLYGLRDVEACLEQIKPSGYGEWIQTAPGIRSFFRHSGHILGSAIVELEIGLNAKTRLVFSGDLGRWNRPVLKDPDFVPEADVLLVESTYGNRVHAPDPVAEFARVIREAAARGGVLIIPAFAVGRTQELLWHHAELESRGEIPSLPVYIDSPMAIDVTDIYTAHREDHDLDMRILLDKNRCPFSSGRYKRIRTPEESKALNSVQGPAIIIAGSGMAAGGRVVHHLNERISDPRTTVLLAGFQAAGTRGRSLQDGAKTLRMYGENVSVRARIEMLDGLSAHADKNEIMKWLSGFRKPPRKTYVVHGEPLAAAELADAIRKDLGWNAEPAQDGKTVTL